MSQGYDSRINQTFYRPIGGKIEFGERAADTVTREVREEISAEIADLAYLGTLENIFTYEGQPGHEIVMIYDGRFLDPAMNRDDVMVQGTDDGDILYEAGWKRLDFFRGQARRHFTRRVYSIFSTLPNQTDARLSALFAGISSGAGFHRHLGDPRE